MNEKFNIEEMLALNLIDDETEKQDIENQIRKSYQNLVNDINKKTNSSDALVDFKYKMKEYSDYEYDHSKEFNQWAKSTGLKNIIPVKDVKEEIMNYFDHAEDSRIRDNWNNFRDMDDYIEEDEDRFHSFYGWHTADEMIDSYLPKNYPNSYNAYIYADLSYSRHNKPYGYVDDFDIKNITPELKQEIFNNIKNSDSDFFEKLEHDEITIK